MDPQDPRNPNGLSFLMQAMQKPRPAMIPDKFSPRGTTYQIKDPSVDIANAMAEDMAKAQQAVVSVENLFDLADQEIPAPAATEGPGAVVPMLQNDVRAFGTTGIGQRTGFMNQRATAFMKFRNSQISSIARGLGEIGVLTDEDIDRIKPSMPDLYDTVEIRARKRADYRQLMEAKLTLFQKAWQEVAQSYNTQPVPAQNIPQDTGYAADQFLEA